jgi:hypothetical protein
VSAAAAVLMAALLVGHELGDFTPLATARMLRAKSEGGPIGPIAAHAAVHGVFVGLAVLIVAHPSPSILALAIGVEFVTHFAIDIARARIGLRVPVLKDAGAGPFWWALGFDQLLHGLVLVGIAFLVLG